MNDQNICNSHFHEGGRTGYLCVTFPFEITPYETELILSILHVSTYDDELDAPYTKHCISQSQRRHYSSTFSLPQSDHYTPLSLSLSFSSCCPLYFFSFTRESQIHNTWLSALFSRAARVQLNSTRNSITALGEFDSLVSTQLNSFKDLPTLLVFFFRLVLGINHTQASRTRSIFKKLVWNINMLTLNVYPTTGVNRINSYFRGNNRTKSSRILYSANVELINRGEIIRFGEKYHRRE